MPAISLSTVVRRRDHALTNELSDTETVMLDIEHGRYYGLRDVGKVVWEQLESPTKISDLCEHLVARFDVDLETCRREVTTFLERLHDQGLVEVSDAESGT